MMVRKYDRVLVGWRVMGTAPDQHGIVALRSISRVYGSEQAALDYRELAIAPGIADAYIQKVERPERKVPDIA